MHHLASNYLSSTSKQLPELPVIPFSPNICAFSNRNHSWQQFHAFRNEVLDILSRYGSVGPMGKMPILDTSEEANAAWQSATKNPDFFVVDDDMYGMSVRVEADCVLAKPVLLEELAMFLGQFREWCIYLALVKGGLFVFHDRILYEGDFFSNCHSVSDLYSRCALCDGEDSNLH